MGPKIIKRELLAKIHTHLPSSLSKIVARQRQNIFPKDLVMRQRLDTNRENIEIIVWFIFNELRKGFQKLIKN